MQLDPVSDQPLHADFRRIEKDTIVRVPIPVRFLNEGAAPGIKVGGVLNIRWLTQRPGEDARSWVSRAIAYRDRKRRIYHLALGLVMLSMLFYQAAVLIVVLQL